MSNENLDYYQDTYEIGYEKIIDALAAATSTWIQGLRLTLFFKDIATTRDVNKAQIYAAQGHQDDLLHSVPAARVGGHRGRGLRVLHVVGVF